MAAFFNESIMHLQLLAWRASPDKTTLHPPFVLLGAMDAGTGLTGLMAVEGSSSLCVGVCGARLLLWFDGLHVCVSCFLAWLANQP